MHVQRKWMYLESIFVGSDDIRHQLPAEARRFDGIDKQWQRIMTETARNVNVLEACSADGRLQTLQVGVGVGEVEGKGVHAAGMLSFCGSSQCVCDVKCAGCWGRVCCRCVCVVVSLRRCCDEGQGLPCTAQK